MELQWTGKDEPKPLFHKVTLEGAKSPRDFFHIRYYPQAVGKCENSSDCFFFHKYMILPLTQASSGAQLSEEKATKLANTQQRATAGQEKSTSPLSSPPSTVEFLNKVAAKIPAKWRMFAFNVNIECNALDEIELKYRHLPTECFMHVFEIWKKSQSPPFTWETVIEVLQSPAVGESKMAKDIKHDLCN